jgi:hypothetical protein
MAEKKAESDGGRTALSGFLYQMLVALGLSGHGSQQRKDDHISALLSLTEGASVVHEAYGGDVALLHTIQGAAKKGVVLVQCKFSKSGTSSEIAPKEFKEILDRLNAAAKEVRADGRAVTGFFLVTNRKLSPGSDKIENDVKASGKSGDLNRIQNCIARQLAIDPPSEPESWERQLATFASEFGVLPEEYDEGKERLLGRLLEKTGSASESDVSRAMLVECLTRSREARRITHASMKSDFDAALQRLGDVPRHPVVDRPRADSDLAVHCNRALILCTGQGGTGKTATLQKWAQRGAQTKFVAVRRPANVTDDWIAAQVNAWRGLATLRDSPPAALSRLQVANPQMRPPLFLLCLDGIDERVTVGPNTQYLSSILEWFWLQDRKAIEEPASPPKAQLVVTCRRKEDFEQFWCPNSSGSPNTAPELPPSIPFGDFDDDEFAMVVDSGRGMLSQDICNRLLRTTSDSVGAAEAADAHIEPTTNLKPAPDAPEMVLRHPAMWEAFTRLPADAMRAFLDRQPDGEAQLAANYVDRVFVKAAARSHDLRREMIELAFIKLAAATRTSLGRAKHPLPLWNRVIGQDLVLGAAAANTLLDEALSSGLVTQVEYDAWAWRFPFVQRYLASKEKSS